jgi:signal transduction histidine kinase
MSNSQKVLLALSCILFAATVYSLFNFEVYLIILFFLLHSLCLIFFAYKTYSGVTRDEDYIETYHQDVGMEIASKDNEINELTERLDRSETSLKDAVSENEELKREVELMRSNISEMEKEKATYEEKMKESESQAFEAAVQGLLPPLTEGRDDRATVNIIAVAKQACDELMDSARSAGLILNVSSQGDTLLVRADPNRIITLFRNIIDNSIKYMKRAGSLVITISTIGDDIFIVLKDTGEGLNEDETKHIFELNFQGSNRISGNGLGLAQARAIVESYGGTIYAKSTEGKGMGIYIQLPA